MSVTIVSEKSKIVRNILDDCKALLFFSNKNIVLRRRTIKTITSMHQIQGLTLMWIALDEYLYDIITLCTERTLNCFMFR